ncbi:MAG: hypothetical protein ACE5Q6_23785 [Dehalococcoidia bacterium]
MPRKTDKQLLLEARNPGKTIKEIITEALEAHRGEPHLVEVAAADLGISKGTMGGWCRENDVDVDQFKYGRPPQRQGEEVSN